MANFQNNWNLLKKKSRFLQLITPGAIILIVILLGVAVLFLLQDRPINFKGTVNTQEGTSRQNGDKYSASANKTNQLPAFDITKRLSQLPINNETDYLKWMSLNTPEKKELPYGKWERAQAIIANQDAADPRVH